MNIRKLLLAVSIACFALPAAAGQYSNALSACLADNTSGKERKELAKWIFIGMAAHPEIQELSKVTTAVRDDTDKQMGQLVSRLLTESCVTQARAAVNNEGGDSFKTAFSSLGQLAMQELMTNADVEASLSGWQKYFDRQKFESVMSAKAPAPAQQ
jgi:hypothetical protein